MENPAWARVIQMRSSAGFDTIGSARAVMGMPVINVIRGSAQRLVLLRNRMAIVTAPLEMVDQAAHLYVPHVINSARLAPLKQTLVISRVALLVEILMI